MTVANGGANIAQNTWIVIKGQHLAPAGPDVVWGSAVDFASGLMRITLGGVTVTVNAKAAYVSFYCSEVASRSCSTDQINALTPLDQSTGPVQISVNNGTNSGSPVLVNVMGVAPSLLQFTPKDYVVGTHLNNQLLGPTSLYPGSSTPAKPGEIVTLYGVGFGLPIAPLVERSAVQSGVLPVAPACKVGSLDAVVGFAGLISPGLYQVNVTIPPSAPSGDVLIVCTYGGFATAPSGLITIASKN